MRKYKQRMSKKNVDDAVLETAVSTTEQTVSDSDIMVQEENIEDSLEEKKDKSDSQSENKMEEKEPQAEEQKEETLQETEGQVIEKEQKSAEVHETLQKIKQEEPSAEKEAPVTGQHVQKEENSEVTLQETECQMEESEKEGCDEQCGTLEASEAQEASNSEEIVVVKQSVSLDAVGDAANVAFVNKTKRILEQYEEAQKEKSRLSGELKQSEKAYGSMEKSVADGITVALKQKKEEIAATYDHELSQYQDQIDACKTERAKAKANAIAQRIQVETAPLNQQNQQLEAQIELKFKENKVPVICKKHAISMLFFPKTAQDWIADVLAGMALMFIVPLFLSLAISNRLVLAVTFFVYTGVLFAAYIYLLHKFMLKYAGVNAEVEELRKQIRVNNKNKQLMTNRIKKSQDETGYNLGSFDDNIAGIQQIMQETVAKRQEALENFESEIRHQITADITAANKEELSSLQQQFEDKRQELSDKKQEIEQIEEEIKNDYESVLGKDIMYKQLGRFDSFCQENSDLSIEESLEQYKALTGSSKLLKK